MEQEDFDFKQLIDQFAKLAAASTQDADSLRHELRVERDEQAAWDSYVNTWLTVYGAVLGGLANETVAASAAKFANAILAERRKTFGLPEVLKEGK